MHLQFKIVFILFTLSASFLKSQETIFVSKKFDTKQISETFFVLKSNKSIKHGAYNSYFLMTPEQSNAVKKGQKPLSFYQKQQGFYHNGKKHGKWIEYSKPGALLTEGHYDSDRKIGVWVTSKENGEVLERYDHTLEKKLMPEINIRIQYPPIARDFNIQGEVVIQYQVLIDCTISDIKVIKSVKACDAAVIKSIQKRYQYLKKYGPAESCKAETTTFSVNFHLEE